MLRPTLLAVGLALATPVAAQSVIGCDGWQASARNIVEPWDQFTRTFANGAIRITMLDTIEPAAGALYLMVSAPPYDELGGKNCAVIAEDGGGVGFMDLMFPALRAEYDPARGLTLWIPARRYAPSTGGYDEALIGIVINQAAGTITAFTEMP